MYPPSITVLGIIILILCLFILGIWLKDTGDATAKHEKSQDEYEWNPTETGEWHKPDWDGIHRRRDGRP